MKRVLALLGLCSTTAIAAPFVWVDHAALIGTTSKAIVLEWIVDVSHDGAPEFYELQGTWLERPSQGKAWVLHATDVVVTAISSDQARVRFELKLPGAGHFSFQQRNCVGPQPAKSTKICSEWANTLDPNVGRAGGKGRSWWAYGYLEPLAAPIPLEAPESVRPLPQITWLDHRSTQ